MRYVPSPIAVQCEWVYSAIANKSGRMQYHKIQPGKSKLRISRNEFIRVFNNAPIIAMKPTSSWSSMFELNPGPSEKGNFSDCRF